MTANQFKTHKDLMLWQKALSLATEVHRSAHRLPRHELFGLTSQIRRAAVSIPSNVAEGAGRRTTREFLTFLYIARGSAAELDTQLILIEELGYLAAGDLAALRARTEEVGRLLNATISALHRRLSRPST